MFVDASAIIAILAREADGPILSARVDGAERVYTSAIAIYEAVMGIARVRSASVAVAGSVVDRFLEQSRAEIIPIDAEIGRGALRVFDLFGRGQHPARLNMGDCFAYACARTLDVPLLFKGDDFGQTDITLA
jgi:ribonuclease VapC